MVPIPDPSARTYPSQGVVYISTGNYLDEACLSVSSLKQTMPDVHVTVFTEREPPSNLFDRWIKIEDPIHSGRDKVIQLKNTPYHKTIYLDSDTYVAEPLDDMFSMLEDYDFMGVIEDARGYWYGDETGVPKPFPEINAGVLAFRKTVPITHILNRWDIEYEKSISWQRNYGSRIWDQPSLRKLLWEGRKDIKLAVLPSEYNLLSTWGSFLFGDPIIIHTRNKPARMLERMRRHKNNDRVHLGQIGCVRSPYDMTFAEWFVTFAKIHAVFFLAFFKIFPNQKRTRRAQTSDNSG